MSKTIGLGIKPSEEQNKRLFEVFRSVLEKWAFLPCDPIGNAVEGPANLPLERMVGFSGSQEGYLVVRAPERFGRYLWENVSGEESADGEGPHGDAFTEFVNLYFGHLLTGYPAFQQGGFEPYLPIPSVPANWPAYDPHAAITFLVEDMPVEVRLWLGGSNHGGPRL